MVRAAHRRLALALEVDGVTLHGCGELNAETTVAARVDDRAVELVLAGLSRRAGRAICVSTGCAFITKKLVLHVVGVEAARKQIRTLEGDPSRAEAQHDTDERYENTPHLVRRYRASSAARAARTARTARPAAVSSASRENLPCPVQGAAIDPDCLQNGLALKSHSGVPDYRADPDLRALLESGLALPPELEAAEVARLERFLAADQVLERFYRRGRPEERPPEADLEAAAATAMEAYNQRSPQLPVGWQKFLVRHRWPSRESRLVRGPSVGVLGDT